MPGNRTKPDILRSHSKSMGKIHGKDSGEDWVTRQCEGKQGYDKKTALTKQNVLKREHGRIVRVYKCKICPWFHFTHQIRYN